MAAYLCVPIKGGETFGFFVTILSAILKKKDLR